MNEASASNHVKLTKYQPGPLEQLDDYPNLLKVIRGHMESYGSGPLFTTSASGLYDAFLSMLPENVKQHYTCQACRRFVDTYGGLVTIRDDGQQIPVFWDESWSPEFFAPA